MSAPTPARSEMVEKVIAIIDEWESRTRLEKYEDTAARLIATFFDNLPREVMVKMLLERLPYERADEWHAGDALNAAISAARREVLGHE